MALFYYIMHMIEWYQNLSSDATIGIMFLCGFIGIVLFAIAINVLDEKNAASK